MKYYVDTDNRRLNKYDERTQPVVAPADKPRLYFGEKPTITLAFPEGVLVAGRLLVVAVDADMRHGENMTPPMVKAVVEILPANVLTGEVTIELTTNTQRFYEMTNGLPVNGCRQGAFGVYLRDAETGVYDTLCADIALCYGIVADDTDPVVILPEEIYYTKEQINVIVAQMQAALEGATAAKNAAQTAAANAVGSAGNSYIWAEGTDAQVAELGGEHSAKGWAEEAKKGGGDSARQATDGEIDEREAQDSCITPNNLNYSVTAALTDASHITLTAEQQATAQEVLGVPAPIIGTTAPTTATVGKLMQQYLNSTTGKTYHCTAITNTGTEAEPAWEYTWREDIADVQVNGSSIVSDGVANVRKATGNLNGLGVVAVNAGSNGLYSGLRIDNNGNISLQRTTNQYIDEYKDRDFGSPIVLKNLSYAVRSVSPNVTAIPAETTAYALLDATATTNNHSWQYTHTPTAAATYTLPAVTDTAVAHRIKLTIDFTTVQTYAFEDSQGTALAPLFTPTISAGDVYEFDCEYSVAKSRWLIWPHKQGAVSDDFVMRSEVGAANGVAGLDADGKVFASNLANAAAGGVNDLGKGIVGNVYPYANQRVYSGITIQNGAIIVDAATEAEIDDRKNSCTVKPTNLNYAVTAALTDANKISLTDAQKASAQDTLGAAPEGLHGSGAPTTSTVGKLLQQYLDDGTQKTYTCTAVTVDETDPQNPVTTYEWTDDVNAKGGTFTGRVSLPGVIIDKTSAIHLSWNMQNDVITITGTSTVISNLDTALTAKEAGIFKLNAMGATHLVTPAGIEPPITTIPSATSAYTLTDGVFQHAPETASVYTLPPNTQMIIVANVYYRREPTLSGDGYYTWVHSTERRYTASPNPSTGDNSYSNTALTIGARPLTVDERTHECILTVRFSSSVLTYAFEDSAGNTLTPLPLAGTIADGSVVCFRCTWEALLNQWVIMPVMLGTYVEVTP